MLSYHDMRLFIFGIGQISEVAEFYFNKYCNFSEIFTVADESYLVGNTKPSTLSTGEAISLCDPEKDKWFVAMSYKRFNTPRKNKFQELKNLGMAFQSFVHPSAHLWSDKIIGENCLILENNVVQFGSFMGNNNIIWSNNHIGHHCKMGNHNFLSSGVIVSGNVNVGDNVFFGVNSTIIDGLDIGDYSWVGPGITIKDNLAQKSRVT